MEKQIRDQSVLHLIRTLSSQRESGMLNITSGMTEGDVYVDRGEVVKATFGKLTGFQAINALASIHDATFHFDPTIAPPSRSSITPNERILLKDFFGIGGSQDEHEYPHFADGNDQPAQVVPLSEVDQRRNSELRELDIRRDASPHSSTQANTEIPRAAEPDAAYDDEVTVVRSKTTPLHDRPAVASKSISKSRFRPALFVAVLTILLAAAAIALFVRLRERTSTASVAVQNPTPSATPTGTPQASNSSESRSLASDLTGNWNVVNTPINRIRTWKWDLRLPSTNPETRSRERDKRFLKMVGAYLGRAGRPSSCKVPSMATRLKLLLPKAVRREKPPDVLFGESTERTVLLLEDLPPLQLGPAGGQPLRNNDEAGS